MISSLPQILAMGNPSPQPGENPTKGLVGMAGYMILIFAFLYLIMIRPQMKQQKDHQKMLDALKVGDRVLVSGSIFGIVSQIKEKSVVVKIAENTKIELLRSGIQQVVREDAKEEKKS
ncbi:MAG: preprotein translocase subunit YajC [Verrucomicrobiae bacterium]|nr:preprotein translocase subunit YajC [Verrucomicrobiae bacterium]